jgi:hypothetical protein
MGIMFHHQNKVEGIGVCSVVGERIISRGYMNVLTQWLTGDVLSQMIRNLVGSIYEIFIIKFPILTHRLLLLVLAPTI